MSNITLGTVFWMMQSDVWGIYNVSNQKIMHSINGWLRNFLWSQAAQVIQSYSTSISGYGSFHMGY